MPTNYYFSQDQIGTINDIFLNPPTGNAYADRDDAILSIIQRPDVVVVVAQRGDGGPAPDLIRGLSLPMADGGVIHEPHPAGRPSGRLGHVRLERSPLCSDRWRFDGSPRSK